MTDETTTINPDEYCEQEESPDSYCGWQNRETWALNLWLSNDEGLYLATQEVADDATFGYVTGCDSYGMEPTDSGRARAIGEAIVEWVRDELGDILTPSAYSDLRDDVGSLWRVDERELGAAWIEEG